MIKFLDNTGLAYLWNKIKALVPGLSKKTQSIPFGQVDSTSTSTVFTATIDGIDELRDGVCCYLRNGVVTSASGFTLEINSLGAKPVYQTLAAESRSTTAFNIAYTMLFIYNSTRVEGGCWDMFYGFANAIGYQIRTNSSTLPAAFKTYRYRLLFTNPNNTKWVAANASSSTNATSSRTPTTEKINPFGPIVYYGSTTAVNANANFSVSYLYQQYAITLGYSFNTTGAALVLTYPAPVYVKCTPQSDGSAIIDSTTPYTQALPNTEDGSIYIYLGLAYSETAIELRLEHPVYYYKGGAIRLWTNASTSGGGGTDDYSDLSNKPQINSVTLSGNQSASDLGLATTAQGALADTAYQLPSGGIPDTDLSSTVQTSLGKADTALQSYTETDPVFLASAAYGISSSDITNWNNKGTYSKPSGGIPASDIASGVIPTVPTNVSSFTNDANYVTSNNTVTIYSGSSAPSGSLGSNGDIYIQTT